MKVITKFTVDIRYLGFNIRRKDSIKAVDFMKKVRRILRDYFKK